MFAELKHLNDGHSTRVDVKKTDPKKTPVFFKSPLKKPTKKTLYFYFEKSTMK